MVIALPACFGNIRLTGEGILPQIPVKPLKVFALSTNPFQGLFGSNPFRALQDHMSAVVECVDLVPGLFKALSEDDPQELVRLKEAIFEKEEEADKLKNSLREHLPRGLFLPVDRRDLIEVLDLQDSMADTAQDIAGLLVERRMSIPAPMAADLPLLVARCVEACHHASEIIGQLDELLETGFRGPEASRVDDLINGLNRVEDETDRMGLNLARLLFDHEEGMNPVSVIFWHRLIEMIGDLADYAEKVGNRLRLMIAR